MWVVERDLKGSCKGDIDVDVEVGVDIDGYFCCLKGSSTSVRVLLSGRKGVVVRTLTILK